jgi:hypothetical protein
MVLALRTPRRLSGRLNRRQQERHENANDRNYHQQLDERKTGALVLANRGQLDKCKGISRPSI